jgi:hypothetical protein
MDVKTCGDVSMLVISDTVIVDFFTQHVDNEVLKTGLLEVAKSYCDAMTRAMSVSLDSMERARQCDEVVVCMRSMEKRILAQIKTHDEPISQMKNDLAALPGKVHGQVLGATVALEASIRESMTAEGLDKLAEKVTRSISMFMEQWPPKDDRGRAT